MNQTTVGWATASVTDIKSVTITRPTGAVKLLKFIVDVEDPAGNYTASQLCEPTLLPGKNLYRWIRVCDVPLSSIDSSINPALFKDKKIKVKIAMNGDFYNIVDLKKLDAK